MQTYAPAYAPASIRIVIARGDRRDEDVQVRDPIYAVVEHAAPRDHDPAAGHPAQRAAEPGHVPEPQHVAAAQHTPGTSADHLRSHHPGRLLRGAAPADRHDRGQFRADSARFWP